MSETFPDTTARRDHLVAAYKAFANRHRIIAKGIKMLFGTLVLLLVVLLVKSILEGTHVGRFTSSYANEALHGLGNWAYTWSHKLGLFNAWHSMMARWHRTA